MSHGPDVVRRAVEATMEARSCRVFFGMSPDGATCEYEQTAEGVADLRNRRTLMLEQPLLTVEETRSPGRGTLRTLVRQRSLRPLTRPMRVLYDGGLVLQRHGKRWRNVAVGGSREGARNVNDPFWLFDALSGTQTVVSAGSDSVRGARVDHYVLSVDVCASNEHSVVGVRLPSGFTREDLEAMPAEIWGDGDGRISRMSYGLSKKRGDLDVESPIWFTTELYDFGVPLEELSTSL